MIFGNSEVQAVSVRKNKKKVYRNDRVFNKADKFLHGWIQ